MDSERIPHPLTTLIGRTDLLTEVGDLLRDPNVRLVTLTGAGGSGKTRLALELADRAARDPNDAAAFILVSLASISAPGRVPLAILRALGLPEDPGRSILVTLCDELAARRAILVLDNFEHVIDAAPHVSELLAGAPNLKILATSRIRLRVRGEREVVVPPMGLPSFDTGSGIADLAGVESVQLFVERARQVWPRFALTPDNGASVAEICARLDGLPLAIELAAARLNVLSVSQLLTRLSNRLDLLMDGPRDLPARQQTIRAAIAWSFDLLTDAERETLTTLSVFAGGFSLAAAEAVAPTPNEAFHPLASLVEKSLVRRLDRLDEPGSNANAPRFALLETIRAFGLEQLHQSSNEPAVRRRHALFVCSLAEAAESGIVGTDHVEWLDRLEGEAGNIRTALRWAIGQEETGIADRIGGSLWLWWFLRGHLQEGRRWLAEIQTLPRRHDPDFGFAKVLTGAGALAELQGDNLAAEPALDEAILRADAMGDRRTAATARFFRGLVTFDCGDLAGTRDYARQSLETFTILADSWGMALALAELGMVELRSGATDAATDLLTQSRNLFQAYNVSWGVAMATANLGLAALEGGDARRCEELLIKALALFHTVGDQWGIAMYLDSLARATREEGRLERAATLFGAHSALCAAIGVSVKPLYRGGYDMNIDAAKTGLGDRRFGEAFSHGQSLSVQGAIAFAAESLPRDERRTAGPTLSPRELDVLRLMTRGQSDRQIGDALFISARTVSAHATNIFAKLDVGSRTAAATVALTRGLV